MGNESDIQAAVMNMLIWHPRVAWAAVMTVGKVKGRGGHWMSLGFPGLSDIIGMTKRGEFIAIEVKRPGEKPSDVQEKFLELVRSYGGIAGWCDSVERAQEILKEEKAREVMAEKGL